MSNLKVTEQRLERRLLCSDIVDVFWKDRSGRPHEDRAVLEDVSSSGLCLQFETPIPRHTRLRIVSPRAEFPGTVRYCIHRETGFFVGVRFDRGFKWARRQFLPRHLFDPGNLPGPERGTPPQS